MLQEAVRLQQYIVFDTETTLINKDKSLYVDPPEFVLGSLYYPRHGINAMSTFYTKSTFVSNLEVFIKTLRGTRKWPSVIVGHNLAFDILQVDSRGVHDSRIIFWDTAIFEYEAYGQQYKFPSLNDSCARYGIESKDSEVSEMIASGISPKDIPKEILEKYCIQDVCITHKLFRKQLEVYSSLSNPHKNLILQRMLFKMNTHAMSINGMVMNADVLDSTIVSLEEKLNFFESRLRWQMHKSLPNLSFEDCNPNSLPQLRSVLFGDSYKTTAKVLTGAFYVTGPRKGEPKSRMESWTCSVAAHVYSSLLGKLVPTLDEQALRKLTKSAFVDDLLEYRSLAKELRTYFKGYKEASKVLPNGDYSVHCEYKHTITPTGRISANKPNMQNLKSGE